VRPAALRGAAVHFGGDTVRRFVDVEGVLQATVLAAQAFTSLIPFLVVAAAIGPGDQDLPDRIVDRFSLGGSAARDVHALFKDAAEVQSTVTFVGVIILVLSALSFTRALQRIYQRAYGHPPSGWRQGWRALAWLGGFAVWMTVSAPLRGTLDDASGPALAIVVSTITGLALWLWTPRILLGPDDWRRYVPGAIVSAVLGAILAAASAIYVPVLIGWSADRYGLIGIAFSLQSWLLTAAVVVVAGAVTGAVASERVG
jgi:membrane protein